MQLVGVVILALVITGTAAATVNKHSKCKTSWLKYPNQEGGETGYLEWGSMSSSQDCLDKCDGYRGCLSVDVVVYDDGHVDCNGQTNQANVDDVKTVHLYISGRCIQEADKQTGVKYSQGPGDDCWIHFTHLSDKQAYGGELNTDFSSNDECLQHCALDSGCVGIDAVFTKKTNSYYGCYIHSNASDLDHIAYGVQYIKKINC